MIKIINRHSEWIVFVLGLVLLGTMNPYAVASSWCFIDLIGFTFCPGEGLGHSIAFIFRGEIIKSVEANLMGPFVVIGLSFRVIQIWTNLSKKNNPDLMENYHV